MVIKKPTLCFGVSLLSLILFSIFSSMCSRFALAQNTFPIKPTMLKESAKKGESIKGLKLAFIDIQTAILQTSDGKQARENIEKEAKKKREELAVQEQELKKMNEDFQAQQAVLSDALKAEKQRDFQKKFELFRSSQIAFEQEFREKEMKETQKIIQNMTVIVEEISKKRSYDLIFEKGSGALFYAQRIDDITADVVNGYNKKYVLKAQKK